MIDKYFLKKFYIFCLTISALLMACATLAPLPQIDDIQSDEVKYFKILKCDKYWVEFDHDLFCKYQNEITKSQLSEGNGYYEVHYKKGNILYSTLFINPDKISIDKKGPIIGRQNKYDMEGHIILKIINPKDYPFLEPFSLHKFKYGDHVKESLLYTKYGKLFHKVISEYKNNRVIKETFYEESGEIIHYSTFNYDTDTKKTFNPDNHQIMWKYTGFLKPLTVNEMYRMMYLWESNKGKASVQMQRDN